MSSTRGSGKKKKTSREFSKSREANPRERRDFRALIPPRAEGNRCRGLGAAFQLDFLLGNPELQFATG